MTALVRAAEPIEERTRARAWVELFAPAVELAKQIASTEFVPKGLRDNVPAITAAILYGDEIGLEPMTALALIAVIDGKPYVAAEAQRALVLAAGHELWMDEATNERVTWAGRRAGSEKVSRITWTMQDARTAQLAGKFNWRNYPRAMLSARSSAELARALFPDVIHGLGALEEYDDAFGTDTAAPAVPAGAGGGSNKRRRAPRLPSPEPAAPGATIEEAASAPAVPSPGPAPARPAAVPPLPGEIPDTHRPRQRTEAQKRKILAGFGAKGVKGEGSRKARLQLMTQWTGRPIESGDDLTFDEASQVIEALEAWEGVQ